MNCSDYDAMAWLYATRWGGEYHAQGYVILQAALLTHLPRGARVLDLCCGDGRIAAQLALDGFHVEGIDNSARMLDYARQRAPAVPFHQGDARSFEVDRPFDAVISTFDSLNHIMTPGDLGLVFAFVARSLNPGGWFVFDLNREEAYTRLWSTTYAIVEPETVAVSIGRYNRQQRVASSDFTVFRLGGRRWERSDFRMSQYCHRAEDVVDALGAAGFQPVTVLDAADDLGMFGNIGRGRNYYVARSRT